MDWGDYDRIIAPKWRAVVSCELAHVFKTTLTLGKPQKSFFFSDMATKRGWGGEGLATKIFLKALFKLF